MNQKSLSVILILLLFPSLGICSGNNEYIQTFESGLINWSTGLIQAKAIGEIGAFPDSNHETISAYPVRKRAFEKIYDTLRLLRIDSNTGFDDLIFKDADDLNRIHEMINSVQIVDQKDHSEGKTEITVQMSIFGGFAQIVLPDDIKQLTSVRSISNPTQNATRETTSWDNAGADVYTGLIVDARKLEIVPAMSPVIFDEDGGEVFGPAYVSRDYAVQYGVCCYLTDIESAVKNRRVQSNPLQVKAIRKHESGSANLVISNADAAKIRSASDHLIFLRQCRVIIVSDK